jgi:hypothetical protein
LDGALAFMEHRRAPNAKSQPASTAPGRVRPFGSWHSGQSALEEGDRLEDAGLDRVWRSGPGAIHHREGVMRRFMVVTAAVTGAIGFITLYRPWHQRWGATDAELAGQMPGDELLPVAEFHPTRAITIDARPEEIWPWIVQIGFNRAGFYAYDLLDNLARPSAERIIPELQDINVGDWIPMSPTISDTTAFRVRAFDPNRWMLWSKPDSTWAWSLRPIDAERTRLVCRIRAKYAWGKPSVLLSLFLLELGDFLMNSRELRGIKRRAEGLADARRAAAPPTSAAAEPVERIASTA